MLKEKKCDKCKKLKNDVKYVQDPYGKYPEGSISTDNTANMNLCYDCLMEIKKNRLL
ncbi:MAG: hypothetical protein PF638_05560 [Candidatus Delongbacteria bacterium]|jgi:hypothetical protein|nr:hypothetical protein [Candidatus Delongbacteria bacterium]